MLRRVYPQADIPIVQLSIDATKPNALHYEFGKRLSPLREEGVLIIGSGNVAHNLSLVKWQGEQSPFDWAVRFNHHVKNFLLLGEHSPLIEYESLGEPARFSVPTPDHYLPLLYVLGAMRDTDKVTFPVDGIDVGSMSMLSIVAQ